MIAACRPPEKKRPASAGEQLMIHATVIDMKSGAAGPDLSAFLVPSGVDPLTQAFERRPFAPPGHAGRPSAPEETEAILRKVYATPRTQAAAAYVHVPYCQNHCLFCGFFQNVWRPEASAAYVDDVVAELERHAETPLVASAPIEAVYIGGGTPTALHAGDLARLVAALRTYLPLATDCEITVEGRSFDFGLAKALAAVEAGANRFSLGVQTFDTGTRRRLGRKLSGDEVAAFLAELVGLNRASIVIDLIYGLPGQTADTWRADIERAAEIALDGISLYALNIWRGGPLAKAIEAGKLAAAGDLAAQAHAYVAALDRLTELGWNQVAQAHVVRSARERNRYNRMMKAGSPCLPFGPGAGGHVHGHRWRNVIDMKNRGEMIAAGRLPAEGLSRVPPFHRAQSVLSAGLEAGELVVSTVDALAPGFAAAAQPLFDNWAAAGLGSLADGRFRTSRAGAFWMVTLASALTSLLATLSPPMTDHRRTA
jgi:oxygen-independent coproporphyrinogen-3 oxidase